MDCGFDKETLGCGLDLWEHCNGILHEAENVVTGTELR
jgi:hypothetical protein